MLITSARLILRKLPWHFWLFINMTFIHSFSRSIKCALFQVLRVLQFGVCFILNLFEGNWPHIIPTVNVIIICFQISFWNWEKILFSYWNTEFQLYDRVYKFSIWIQQLAIVRAKKFCLFSWFKTNKNWIVHTSTYITIANNPNKLFSPFRREKVSFQCIYDIWKPMPELSLRIFHWTGLMVYIYVIWHCVTHLYIFYVCDNVSAHFYKSHLLWVRLIATSKSSQLSIQWNTFVGIIQYTIAYALISNKKILRSTKWMELISWCRMTAVVLNFKCIRFTGKFI